jgi:DNA-binding LytR/AlgR family response regulator
MNAVRAIIAEDEPLLAQGLSRMLLAIWPDLDIAALAHNGEEAVSRALDLLPQILFLDIRMPGKTGLDAAAEVLDAWPEQHLAPLIVFVTAYDEFAIAAFEHAAVDFVLKPVVPERLERTVARLKTRLQERTAPQSGDLADLLRVVQTLALDGGASKFEPLDMVNVGLGDTITMVPVDEVLYFEATDKYVNVVSASHEGVIRTSMRELLCRLSQQQFMQVHRSVIVNRRAIVSATRNELGHVTLQLRGSSRKIPVSRAFAHHFKAM